MRVLAFVTIIPETAKLLMQLLWMWTTLGWHVRKARKAFEKELTRQGMSKRDAQRLSKQIQIAKEQIMSNMWSFGSK